MGRTADAAVRGDAGGPAADAHGAPPRATFDGREWDKPYGVPSNPIGLRQRAGADETLEPPAVRMHLAPVLAGEIDHGEPGGR